MEILHPELPIQKLNLDNVVFGSKIVKPQGDALSGRCRSGVLPLQELEEEEEDTSEDFQSDGDSAGESPSASDD